MANQTTPFHSGYSIINATFTGSGSSSLACWMEYKVISQSAVNNTSTIRYYIYIANVANSSYYDTWCNNYDQTNRGSMTVKLDGTTIYTRQKRGYATYYIPTPSNYTTQYQTPFSNHEGTRFLTVMTDNADTEAAGYGEYTVTHNSNGTKSVTLSWEANCTYTSSLGTVTGSSTVNLPTIDRNAPTVTLQTSNITSKGVTLTVLSSAVADRWEYKLNGGSWVQFSTAEASSASVILDTLSPNTSYTIQARARRKSNHVYGSSSSTTVTTLGGSVITWTGQVTANASIPKIQFAMMVYDSTYTHTLTVSKGGSDLFNFTEITGAVGSNTKVFLLTSAQAQSIMAAMPTETQATLTYTLVTYDSNNTVVGTETTTATALITEAAAPTMGNPTLRDTNTTVTGVTGSTAVIVQGQSTLRVQAATATPGYGTTIAKYSATIGDKTVESSTRTINFGVVDTSGSVTVTVRATDRRGYSVTVAVTLDVIAYENISLESWSVGRQNNVDEYLNVALSGRFSSIQVSGVEKNSLTAASYRYKRSTASSYGSSTSILAHVTVTGTSFSFSDALSNQFDQNYSYHVELTVSDALTSSSVVVYVDKGKPLVAFRSEKVGINTNAPQCALDVAGDIHMNGYNVQGFVATLDDATNLNTVAAPGIYAQPQSGDASTSLNYPAAKAGILEVIAEPSGHVIQRYTTYDLSGFYVRYRFLGNWRAWKSITMS